MRCKDRIKRILSLAIDGKQHLLTNDDKQHLEVCASCREEYTRMLGWVGLLQSSEPWTPPEGFIAQLTDKSMREKHRANLTEATLQELRPGGLTLSGLVHGFLAYPKLSTFGALASVLILILAFVYVKTSNFVGNFDYISGYVQVQSSSVGHVEVGTRLTKGMTLQTARDASSILALRDGSEVTLSSLSRLVLVDPRTIHLQRGKAFFTVKKGQGTFRVIVPNGEVVVYGTAFTVDVNEGKSVVTVYEGEVRFTAKEKTVQLTAGYEGVVTGSQVPVAQPSARFDQANRWFSHIRNKRDREELQKYYPSLAMPEDSVK
jgi:hypothetical protein